MYIYKLSQFSALIICTLLCSPSAIADSPLPAPAMTSFFSPSLTCFAKSNPDLDETLVSQVNNSNIIPLEGKKNEWAAPQWGRQIFVADDCSYIIITYGGLNLLRLNDRVGDTVMFRMYSSGKPVRELTLSKLYKDLDILPRTSSHWAWQYGVGWNGSNLTVHTVDGRQVVISQSDFSPVDGN